MSFLQKDVKLKVEMVKQFSPTVNCFDYFFFNNVEMQLPNMLALTLKIILILSHGQASFKKSVNNTILNNNINCEINCEKNHQLSHEKQRVHIVLLTKDLLYLVKLSGAQYQENLRQQTKKNPRKIKLLTS